MNAARVSLLFLLTVSAGAAEVTRAGRWDLHSSFWMNLHQTLMHDATAREARDLTALSAEGAVGVDRSGGRVQGGRGAWRHHFFQHHGVAAFTPSSEDLFTRVWPKYRQPIETFWYPYLSGTGTLEEAIEKIVAAVRELC